MAAGKNSTVTRQYLSKFIVKIGFDMNLRKLKFSQDFYSECYKFNIPLVSDFKRTKLFFFPSILKWTMFCCSSKRSVSISFVIWMDFVVAKLILGTSI